MNKKNIMIVCLGFIFVLYGFQKNVRKNDELAISFNNIFLSESSQTSSFLSPPSPLNYSIIEMDLSKNNLITFKLKDSYNIYDIMFLNGRDLQVRYFNGSSDELYAIIFDLEKREIIENETYNQLNHPDKIAPNQFDVNQGNEIISPNGKYRICMNELNPDLSNVGIMDQEEARVAYLRDSEKQGIPYGVISIYDNSTKELVYQTQSLGVPPGTSIDFIQFLDDDTMLFSVMIWISGGLHTFLAL